MNIKCLKISLILLVCILLSGCGMYKQQLNEADGGIASVHTLHGQLQGETMNLALKQTSDGGSSGGEAPEDCSGHSYGKWMLGKDNMYRSCSYCEKLEGTEIDYQIYLTQEIVGHWNLFRIRMYDEDKRDYYVDELKGAVFGPDTEIIFKEDGRIFTGGYEVEDSGEIWAFDHAEYDPIKEEHRIYINTGKAETNSYFSCMGDNITYNIVQSNGDILELSKKYGEAVASMLPGQWSTYYEDSVYSITFSEDRSFTADFDGGISGYWQARAFGPGENYIPGQNYEPAPLLLNYYKNGQGKTLVARLDGYRPEKSQEQNMDMTLGVLDMNGRQGEATFSLGTWDLLTDTVAKADSVPLGTWTSVDYYISTAEKQEKGDTTEYSIEFREDGSFSAKLHYEIAGTWEFEKLSFENSKYAVWEYQITAPGINESSYFSFRSVPGIGGGYLSIREEGSSKSIGYNMKHGTAEELANEQADIMEESLRLIGHWNADSVAEYETGVQMDADAAAEFYIDIAEDGRFSAYFGEEVQGTWEFVEMEDGVLRYGFQTDGTFKNYSFYLNGESLYGYYTQYRMYFSK